MRYYAVRDRKKLKEAKLTALDKTILDRCGDIGLNIVRILKAGKPYISQSGGKEFATTTDIVAAVRKLQKLELLERR